DQRGTPTFTRDAAACGVRVMEAGLEGTIHAANHGVTTWWEFACEVVRLSGLKTPVDAIRTEEGRTPAVRPRNSALGDAGLGRAIGDGMRGWREALVEYLDGHLRSGG